jgi:hypothetical protein
MDVFDNTNGIKEWMISFIIKKKYKKKGNNIQGFNDFYM